MSEIQRLLKDGAGEALRPGDFFLLEESMGVFAAGPYKYVDWRYGTRVYAVGDMEFMTSTDLAAKSIRLHWKKWKNKREHYERFQLHYQREKEKLL